MELFEDQIKFNFEATGIPTAGGDVVNKDYVDTLTQADYIVRNVAEFDAALSAIATSEIGGSICLKKGTYNKGSAFVIPSVSNIRIFSEGGAIIVPPYGASAIIIGSDLSTYIYNIRIENIKFEGSYTTEPVIKTLVQSAWSDYRLIELHLEKLVFGVEVHPPTTAAIKLISMSTWIINCDFSIGTFVTATIEQMVGYLIFEENNSYYQSGITIPADSYLLLFHSTGNSFLSYASVPFYVIRTPPYVYPQRIIKFTGNFYAFANGQTTDYIIDADGYVDGCHIADNTIFHTGSTIGAVAATNIAYDPSTFKFVEHNYQLSV